MEGQNERRSHKLINRWAQLRIAAEVVLHAVLLVALIALLLFSPPFVTMFSDYSAEDHVAVARELVLLNASKWPLFVGLALFVGLVSVIFSHHIVGPAYQILRASSTLGERDLSVKVEFRKWDYLNELEDVFNQMTGRFRSDLSSIKQRQNEALKICRGLRSQSGSSEELAKLEQSLAAMGETLGSYTGLE